jgi:hypothetical protein
VRYIVAEYSGGVGVMVDGNAFAATLLRPTVNGVVVPTLSIALGTLLATTVNVLRDRQVEHRMRHFRRLAASHKPCAGHLLAQPLENQMSRLVPRIPGSAAGGSSHAPFMRHFRRLPGTGLLTSDSVGSSFTTPHPPGPCRTLSVAHTVAAVAAVAPSARSTDFIRLSLRWPSARAYISLF